MIASESTMPEVDAQDSYAILCESNHLREYAILQPARLLKQLSVQSSQSLILFKAQNFRKPKEQGEVIIHQSHVRTSPYPLQKSKTDF